MDDTLERVSVILPSLNPTEKFDRVVDGLIAAGFRDILIIDDGSREDRSPHFDRAAALPQCTVLTHPVNRGKGAALKTAFAWLGEHRPQSGGAVTIDGDGQHLAPDILRCAAAIQEGTLVLGCRDFSGEEVPKKSRMGNRITSAVFRLLCGIRLSDTQTGLRGVPPSLFRAMTEIAGDRYDYETNMLLELNRQGVQLREVPIETVYEDGNSESHFRPFVDSVRIYRFILLYALSSLAGAAADLAVFYLLRRLLDGLPEFWAVAWSTVGARAVSSFLNFNLNNRMVFHGKDAYFKTLIRYYALCVPLMLASAGLVYLFSHLAGTGASFLTTLLKLCVDTLLFFLSFRIQQRWVFRGRKER